MRELRRLFGFVRPYGGYAVLALIALGTLVVLDLSIPRLIQRIIDEGILKHDRGVVVRTAVLMLALSLVSAVIAVGNNVFSVRVGEGVARDLRAALFRKIQGYCRPRWPAPNACSRPSTRSPRRTSTARRGPR